jgi:hypothetical protein
MNSTTLVLLGVFAVLLVLYMARRRSRLNRLED